jgi:hypothetical protein
MKLSRTNFFVLLLFALFNLDGSGNGEAAEVGGDERNARLVLVERQVAVNGGLAPTRRFAAAERLGSRPTHIVAVCNNGQLSTSVPDMGTFFPLGGGGYIPPTPKNFACSEQKKKVVGISEKFFTTWKNLPYPPNQFWPEVWYGGPWGVYTPLPPTPISDLSPVFLMYKPSRH